MWASSLQFFKTNDKLQCLATSLATNAEELTNENITEAYEQDEEHQTLDPAKDFEEGDDRHSALARAPLSNAPRPARRRTTPPSSPPH